MTCVQAHLTIAQDPQADAVLSSDPFALLCGMLLDQQFPMERAFAGPAGRCETSSTLPLRRVPPGPVSRALARFTTWGVER